MTRQQAADFLGVNSFTIIRLIKRGSIKAEKFGPAWMIDPASLEDYKSRNEGRAPRDPRRR
jgi:excisionase family DNA binding protein